MTRKSGFTLIEILIVMTILGVLAATVVPKFSSAALDSRTSVLRQDLQAVRGQIGLYRHHHNEALPAAMGETGEDFARRMTTRTDRNGEEGTEFGPYMQRIPINPFTSTRTVRVGGMPAGANTHAWRFDPETGWLQSDDNFDGNNDGEADHVSF